MANKVISADPTVRQHRLINSYVDSYKLKLCLKEQKDPLEKLLNKETSLTIDFNELQRLALASTNPKFDPLGDYLIKRKEERVENKDKGRDGKLIKAHVDSGLREIEALKRGEILEAIIERERSAQNKDQKTGEEQ
jgi:hypothetical protein